jgi:hypothetical protein
MVHRLKVAKRKYQKLEIAVGDYDDYCRLESDAGNEDVSRFVSKVCVLL